MSDARTDTGNSGRYVSALFPEAAPTPVTVPDWMRGIDAPVRGANFDRDLQTRDAHGARGETAPDTGDGYFNQPPSLDNRKADGATQEPESATARAELDAANASLAEERDALAAERAELTLAQDALRESTAAVHALLASLETQRAVAREAIEEEIAAVALAVAEAIIGDGLDRARAEALIDAAIAPLDGEVVVKVGSALAEVLAGGVTADEPSTDPGAKAWTMDPSLEPFGCIAEGRSGRVLAGIEARLDAARSTLEDGG